MHRTLPDRLCCRNPDASLPRLRSLNMRTTNTRYKVDNFFMLFLANVKASSPHNKEEPTVVQEGDAQSQRFGPYNELIPHGMPRGKRTTRFVGQRHKCHLFLCCGDCRADGNHPVDPHHEPHWSADPPAPSFS